MLELLFSVYCFCTFALYFQMCHKQISFEEQHVYLSFLSLISTKFYFHFIFKVLFGDIAKSFGITKLCHVIILNSETITNQSNRASQTEPTLEVKVDSQYDAFISNVNKLAFSCSTNIKTPKKEVLRASTSFSRSIFKSKVTQRKCNFVIM